MKSHPLSSVAGGKPHENAQLILDLFSNKLDPETSQIENFVVLNAAALLVVAGQAKDEKEGVVLARESISSGSAMKALCQYRDLANAALHEEEEDDRLAGRG